MIKRFTNESDNHEDQNKNLNGDCVSKELEQLTPDTKIWVGTYENKSTDTFTVYVEVKDSNHVASSITTGTKP